jgi:lipid-A-disaccharide synthase
MDDLTVVGFWEVLRKLPAHLRVLRQMRGHLSRRLPELALLVDYPGFNLRVARAATGAGVPVLYYIAPQLWAWRPGRAAMLRRVIRNLAVILPFEEAFFQRLGINTTFVGHPLLDRPPAPNRGAARARLGVPDTAPALALFAGSRPGELLRHWPLFRRAAERVRRAIPEVRVIVAGATGRSYPELDGFTVVTGDTQTVLAASDAALCKSGTATLEAALAGVPMVVAYTMHSVTFAIARRVVRSERIGLPNILLERLVVPELIQDEASPERLADAVLTLLDRDGASARRQREALVQIRPMLGSTGVAGRVADMALEARRR